MTSAGLTIDSLTIDRQYRSPNHGPRKDGLIPNLIVLHYTALPSADAAARYLCDPATQVSAHWLIGADGKIHALVDETRRAWHAGAGTWGGADDLNSRSIGVELDNDGTSPFAAPLMDALEHLLAQIMARWDIPPKGVIGHSDFAPGRKIDPGARFDWRRLARQGLSIWPEPPGPAPKTAAADRRAFAQALLRLGYPVTSMADGCLAAFRLRFRPAAAGPLSAADVAAAQNLAARFAVDGACRPA